jgi:single-strand DNA-binding protein
MSAVNINSVIITGRLAKDPVLRETRSGKSVCNLRIAVNLRTKDPKTEKFGTKPNYFDVSVWGQTAEHCRRYLSKGRQVAIQGRLSCHERPASVEGPVREFVSIVASTVEFLGSKPNSTAKDSEGEGDSPSEAGKSGGASDEELMAMERGQLDELAVELGVEGPEEYRDQRDVVEAIRENEAAKATADEAEAAGKEPEDIPF